MRRRIVRFCLAIAMMPIAAAAEESPVNISWVEGKDLRLYYKNYLSYLEPHVVRTFTNSLAWQRRMFGWVPSEPTIILLEDFADYGGANTAPRGSIVVSVAPKSNAFGSAGWSSIASWAAVSARSYPCCPKRTEACRRRSADRMYLGLRCISADLVSLSA